MNERLEDELRKIDPIGDAKLQAELRAMLRTLLEPTFTRWLQLVAEKRARDGEFAFRSACIFRADVDDLRSMLLQEADRMDRNHG